MSPQFNEMVEVAQSYCGLIDGLDGSREGWLDELAQLLPRLHLAVAALSGTEAPVGEAMAVDLDARFELFSTLRALLGERDSYWLEFDSTSDEQSMSGSLADDLTDIYCELKQGLRLLDVEPVKALAGWRSGYRVHWGQHLVDAERHIYNLRSRNQLPSRYS